MARYQCVCGTILSNGVFPNDIELYLLTDRQVDEIDEVSEIYDVSQSIWQCPDCKRLTFFNKEGTVSRVYKLESERIE
ncbi:hypothetical protein DFP97_106315 [Paenibacillus prosopidis]|uniref:Uncharacterized protein n=1 Tax=Paenibacillus prosopidis TaxID=630520 RepID=A0A368W1X8_9BACL|nr:hypothetical protein DFP97_106315 [Paenibacillus prosopidis]